MPVPTLVNDGNGEWGSPILTINGNTYKTNNVTVSRPVTKAVRQNQDGKPSDQRWTADVATMTGEIQTNSTLPMPQFGDEFTLAIANSGYGSETWVMGEVGTALTNSNSEFRTAPFTADKRINNTAVTKVY